MEIEKEVWEIIEKIKNKKINNRDNNEWLTDTTYNLDGIDMTYLVLELQKKFRIQFQKSDFENYKFAKVNGIVSIIQSYC